MGVGVEFEPLSQAGPQSSATNSVALGQGFSGKTKPRGELRPPGGRGWEGNSFLVLFWKIRMTSDRAQQGAGASGHLCR